MIAAAFGYEPVDKEPRFGDVTEGDWYYKPVMALYQAGIVSGTGAGRFGASDPLSRQDMAVILSRVLADREISLPEARIYKEFSDEAQIAGYAGEALRQMYCAGLMSGTSDTTLAPAENSTRAQVAVVLTKILKEAGK